MYETEDAPTLVEHMERMKVPPDMPALHFLRDSRPGSKPDTMSYGQLMFRARAVAALLDAHCMKGKRVILAVGDTIDFPAAFLGCLFAGAVAVPGPLPTVTRASTERLAGIVEDCRASIFLTNEDNAADLAQWLTDNSLEHLPYVCIDALPEPGATRSCLHPTSDDPAYLQYTSGSTAIPKGVVISHRNLMANLAAIRHCIAAGPQLRAIGWLPFSHDMGMVGQLLSVLHVGGTLLYLPPEQFLRRPHRWLELCDSFAATHTVAPNFAYDLCLRRMTDAHIASLDLSRLQVALNGAEPIRAKTIEEFIHRFAPADLKPSVMSPCYGMAEATLIVSGSPHGHEPVIRDVDADALDGGLLAAPRDHTTRTRRIVSCGPPASCDVMIVDPDTLTHMPEGNVAEIWVRGPSTAAAYWDSPLASAATFGRRLAPQQHDEFLATGDLGAVWDGQLYVTGRLKDVMIVRGKNIYPHDLEHTVTARDPALAGLSCAAFADDGAVMIIQEARPATIAGREAELVRTIRASLVANYSIPASTVAFVRPGTVCKTTSGKVQRSRTQELLSAGVIEPFHLSNT